MHASLKAKHGHNQTNREKKQKKTHTHTETHNLSLLVCPFVCLLLNLSHYLAPLSFVQVSERIIEASRKQVGQANKAASANIMSINLRVPEMLQELSLRQDAFAELIGAFTEVRQVKRFW